MFLSSLIRKNVPGAAILLFIVLFAIVQAFKPSFLYNQDGSLREFGVGYKSKTVVPIWLITIVLAILCYLAVLYVISY
jgi:hypothetical protein